MKFSYILHKIAQHTYTSARMFDQNRKLLQKVCADPDIRDDELAEGLMKRKELAKVRPDMPLLFFVDHTLVYCLAAAEEGFFLLGPTRFQAYPEIILNLVSPSPSVTSALASLTPYYHLAGFCEDILLLCNLQRSGESDDPFLDPHALLMANCHVQSNFRDALPALYNRIFDNVENSFAHNPYNHEKRQVASIREGDPDRLAGILEERFPGRYGKLSSDPLRQEIYIGIVETTLASRAAIDGGLHPEIAYNLSDITIQKLDTCRSALSAMHLSREMQLQYARLVSEIRKDKGNEESSATENIHISHCKDYVFAHLHGKLTVREIADAIGLEENYLSALFKKKEEITLSSYILQEKIKLAKNLLMYSSYSFIEIAAYLGFSSQSHFGQVFKKITGTTPKSFRDVNASEDFMVTSMKKSGKKP